VSIELLTVILFASVFLILATGIPIAFGIGAVAAVFAVVLWGPERLAILAAAGFSSIRNVNLAAIPLFIFLGWLFKSSGVGDRLFETVYVWLGKIPGGLAIGCLLISILLGAICGGLVLGFSTLWYGVVFLINIQVAFLSPPFGFALFIMKAAVPTELNVTLVDIYRAVIPFIGLAVLALILTMVFPPLATFLPHLVIGK
jgi:TRAP-type mannitol/chloroaromatic compound transport system permease large subunit